MWYAHPCAFLGGSHVLLSCLISIREAAGSVPASVQSVITTVYDTCLIIVYIIVELRTDFLRF